MRTVKIKNKMSDELILSQVSVADTFPERLKGLLGKKGLARGEGMLILPCNSVHSFHMRFAFDVAFVDCENRVLHIIHSMQPWKVSPTVKNAKYVIEASGDYLYERLKVGDEIEVI